ncbi:MAG: arylsulfatase [Verrucomicrobiaceae bacterium]|nr:arylsulfatase [Verrucomicrobiaceae bacterium]
MRRFFLSFGILVASSLTAFSKPNVILIVTDDQGYGDLSCHGNLVLKTPNLDALHGESLRLTDYHVSPTCAPTRSAIMTGHFANRTGCWHTINGRSILRENEVTMAQVFKEAGYATAMYGKWHLGDNYPSRPEDKGFTEVYRHGGGGVGQTPDYWDNAYFDGSYHHNGKMEPAEGYCTDVFFSQAKKFIKSQADKKQPFFIYLCTNAPHGPNHSPEKFSAPYSKLAVPLANFFGMIANIDENVGSLRAFLAENGIADDTIFIFTTDNGTASGSRIFNAKMRAAKGSEYDGGHRVPFFLHWPAKGWKTGRDIDRLTAHVDLLPTFIDLLDLPAPKGVKFDGTSIVPLLEGKVENWPDRVLVTDSQRIHTPVKWRKSAVMTDRWRLVNGAELYDIKSDAGQETDRAKDYPEIVQRLRTDYETWWASMEPSFSDDCEITLGNPADNPAVLTAHDWLLPEEKMSPWNHSAIRAQKGEPAGAWAVKVETAGRYRIGLRRWPVEADHPIAADLPPGKAVPGVAAYRTTPGLGFAARTAKLSIAGKELEAAVPGADATHVDFELDLPAGVTKLQGTFIAADGAELGSYYAVVEKLQ